jgi:hypothetical protein
MIESSDKFETKIASHWSQLWLLKLPLGVFGEIFPSVSVLIFPDVFLQIKFSDWTILAEKSICERKQLTIL